MRKKALLRYCKWIANHRSINGNKGSALPEVIIIALVLSLLGAVILNSVFTWRNSVRNNEHAEYAYIAAESAVERSFCNMDNVITKPGYAADAGIPFNGNISVFANAVIAHMRTDGRIARDFSIDILAGPAVPAAPVHITDIEMPEGPVRNPASLNKLTIPVQITAVSKLESGLLRAFGRKVVACRQFDVYIPVDFELRGAVYTLGDMLAEGGAKPRISGDVYIFGTGVEKKGLLEQYYLGGIYARNNAEMTIHGNAYTRSLIRVGKYADPQPMDGSKIFIYGDAIAHGIQTFAGQTAIMVQKNAYTFDDLEIDGVDSVIGINGSYFGLSNGDGTYHDTSSAVINAAPLHDGNSDLSRMSRIVINGDVIINGSTYNLDLSTGTVLHEIEDASLAWLGSMDPLYGWREVMPFYVHDPSSHVADYIANLRASDAVGLIKGFLNIFQRWPGTMTDLGGWYAEINTVRSVAGKNNFAGTSVIPERGYISGFCNYAMAANDAVFFTDQSGVSGSEIKSIEHLHDYTVNLGGMDPSYWQSLENITDNGAWASQYYGNENTPETFRNKLKAIREGLLGQTHVLAERKYAAVGEGISYTLGTNFNKIKDGLNSRFSASSSFVDNCVRIYNSVLPGGTINLCSEVSTAVDSHGADTYYLLVNNRPENDIVIDGAFNGIVFTTGRVIVKDGGKVNGAIIAAGRGYDAAGGIVSAADTEEALPRVKDTLTMGRFESGAYAAIKFDQAGSRAPEITFPGRELLLDKMFNNMYTIDLYGIF